MCPQQIGRIASILRVYTEDESLNETMPVKDGDVILAPRGHHPCAAPYGFDMGEGASRSLIGRLDSEYAFEKCDLRDIASFRKAFASLAKKLGRAR